jgi:hypothetical protein
MGGPLIYIKNYLATPCFIGPHVTHFRDRGSISNRINNRNARLFLLLIDWKRRDKNEVHSMVVV